MAILSDQRKEPIKQSFAEEEVCIHGSVSFATTNATTSDTVELAKLPAVDGAFIIPTKLMVEVVTAEGGTATIDIGLKPTSGSSFTADPNGLDDAVNINATAGTVSEGVVATDAQMGKRIDIDNGATLYIGTIDNNLDTAVINYTLKYLLVTA